jgi:toxin ParE1/3/4
VKPFHFGREADAEFTAALRYYGEISAELGARFYDEIDAAITDVCAHPRRYRQVDPPVRRRLLPSFPYALLYLDEPERIWIVSVMPLKREPGYWQRRLG